MTREYDSLERDVVCIRCFTSRTYNQSDAGPMEMGEWWLQVRRGLCDDCVDEERRKLSLLQPSFDDLAAEVPGPAGGKRPTHERFEEFHIANPHVCRALVKYAREARRHGCAKASIWMVANEVRWQTFIQTSGDDVKLNNDYLSLYSRLIMATEDDLNGFFAIRERRTA